MEFLKSKLVVVTNAGSDIGFVISEKLVDAGAQVLGLGTKVNVLEDISIKLSHKCGTFQYFIGDLSNEQDIINAINWAKENIGPVYVLINNASVDLDTNLTSGRTKDWKKIFDVNVIGLNVITREVVKNMIEDGIDGHIIHITATSENGTTENVCKSTRQAVNILADCLRSELKIKKSKIKVTTLSPGHIRNGVKHIQGMEEMPTLKSEDIANAVAYILSTSSNVQIHELTLSAV